MTRHLKEFEQNKGREGELYQIILEEFDMSKKGKILKSKLSSQWLMIPCSKNEYSKNEYPTQQFSPGRVNDFDEHGCPAGGRRWKDLEHTLAALDVL